MIVTIHQPEYLPWLGFFNKMRQADLFVLLDTVQFTKDDFQNRNRIKTHKGWVWLTVPVYKKGRSSQRILDVEICNDSKWGRKTATLLRESYGKAPHFAEHFYEAQGGFFEKLYGQHQTSLCDLDIEIIDYLKQALGIETPILRASELELEAGAEGGTDVTHQICRELGADVYLSGAFGRDYLDESVFDASGIEVRYNNFEHPTYEQLWPPFEPRMSAIDLLFNHGAEASRILENTLLRRTA
jgi:hypothetical protein